jgi:putative drug exporter of the RND superfamily
MSTAPWRGPAAPEDGRHAGIARSVLGAPRLVLAVWIVIVASLTALGAGVEHKLALNLAYAPGTEGARAHEIVQREFGNDEVLIVMLQGPRRVLERQGTALAVRLGDLPNVQVISPWARDATITGLQPSPNVGALVVRSDRREVGDVSALLSAVRLQLRRSVSSPVRASVAGFPAILEQVRTASAATTELGEEIALPVLALVLLLVFRSVLAALLPVVVGGAVVAATRGVLDLAVGLTQIDLFAVGVAGMMGLALGVDYSLLVVSRYREERVRARGDAAAAVVATVEASIRSIVPAGCALILAMAAATVVIPNTTVLSVSIAIVTVAALSMLSAICVVPAMLTLLGENLDRWSLPRRRLPRVGLLVRIRRIADHPRAVVLIMLAMLFLAGWAFTLKTGVGGIGLFPARTVSRIQQEEVAHKLGAGWLSPMEVVVAGRGRPVTSRSRLSALADFQRRVERAPGVQTVAGLSQLDAGAKQLFGAQDQLRSQEHGLDGLQKGLARAQQGAASVDSGLGMARNGAQALTDSLRLTSAGSKGLVGALGRAGKGSGDLARGASRASNGAGQLTAALRTAHERSGQVQDSSRLIENAMKEGNDRIKQLRQPLQVTEERLAVAWRALQRMTVGRSDPEYAAAVEALEAADQNLTGNDIRTSEQVSPAYRGLADALERVGGQFDVGSYLAEKLNQSGRQGSNGIGKLARASAQLARGLRGLAAGSARLSTGMATLDQEGSKLPPALRRQSEGSEHLTGGLGAIANGAGKLATGLGKGAATSMRLGGGPGARRAGGANQRTPSSGGSGLARLQQFSPGLFQSSYFVLAGFDGTGSEKRHQIAFLINLNNGGSVARMMVIPTGEATSAGAAQTLRRVQRYAAALGRRTGSEVLVGGTDSFEIELNRALRADVPLLRVLLSLISMFVLVLVMRALTMPAIAALINAITVGATMGLLALLFNGALLGGPGYVETPVLLVAMMVMFGLAIDYEVFVFARMREEYVRTGSTDEAIRRGLDGTAPVITGAAIIMISVFLAFAVTEYAPFRAFGVAEALGVSIDVLVVRLILIPAIMRKLGAASWWMPRWLDRLLGDRPTEALTGVLRETAEST